MAISITICNLALGDIRAPEISDPAEQSREAQVCTRYYQHCLDLLLDDYTWTFLKVVTSSLAENATNDRSSEWAHSFLLPSDCGQAIRLLPSGQYYSQNIFYYPDNVAPDWRMRFIVENGNLYCNIQQPTLEYAREAADESMFPPMFREALAKLLAAKIVVPLLNDQSQKITLLKEAENARQAAIANDMNRYPMQDKSFDDVMLARRF